MDITDDNDNTREKKKKQTKTSHKTVIDRRQNRQKLQYKFHSYFIIAN